MTTATRKTARRDASTADRVREVLTWLERKGTKPTRDGMVRYGIHAPKAFGVPVGTMQQLAKRIGRDHELAAWSQRRDEFIKRAGFALMACLALHDKRAADEPFVRYLPLIERGADDERNFVKKAVSWALRAVGRRNAALNAAAVESARRLAESPEAAPRWVGKDALRELTRPDVQRRLAMPRRTTKA